MAEHITGIRRQPGRGWATGVVHIRTRREAPALELRSPRYHATLREALDALESPARLNGHGGCTSSVLAGTAGLDVASELIRDILTDPGAALLTVWERTGISKAEWARRSGVSSRQIHRIVKGEAEPNSATVRKLLEALQ